MLLELLLKSLLVSIHAPARGATRTCNGIYSATIVSIHAPARGATFANGVEITASGVSIHAPARGATLCGRCLLLLGRVSIHAPARGATSVASGFRRHDRVSIHAPARGATLDRSTCSATVEGFNSRARKGRDSSTGRRSSSNRVSIHAPARGATPGGPRGPPVCGFNSRARKGRDRSLSSVCAVIWFQFTRPQGARHHFAKTYEMNTDVSIHAPARGATKSLKYKLKRKSVSIHAPARGATSTSWTAHASSRGFQFTRPQGARLSAVGIRSHLGLFQFTRPQGARHERRHDAADGTGVSIHAPARGATATGWVALC